MLCYSFRILHYTSLGAVEAPVHRLPLSAQTGILLKWELQGMAITGGISSGLVIMASHLGKVSICPAKSNSLHIINGNFLEYAEDNECSDKF